VNSTYWAELLNAIEYIYNQYGADIAFEPVKVKNLLLDLAPNSKRESKIFINVLSEQALIKRINTTPDLNSTYIISEIEAIAGLSKEWAENITSALLICLGKKAASTVDCNQTQNPTNIQPTSESIEINSTGKLKGAIVHKTESIDSTFNYSNAKNSIKLTMPNNIEYDFVLDDKIELNGIEYFVVSRASDENTVVFFVFKNPSGYVNPPVYLSYGKTAKRVYRQFMDQNKDKYTFEDWDGFHVQRDSIVKGTQKKEFSASTAAGMFGNNLGNTIEIPAKYSSIGMHVFKQKDILSPRREISKLVIPNSVESIESFAFEDILVKDQIIIPDSVKDIGFLAFELGSSGYIVCNEGSYAHQYARENGLRNSVDIRKEYRDKGLCQHCGSTLKSKLFGKIVCTNCGREKDY